MSLETEIQELKATALAVKDERDRLAAALFEVVDAVASIDKPWDLTGYGIEARRAEEICELAELGKPSP